MLTTPADSAGLSAPVEKLALADGDHDDEFGTSVAMAADGTTALVGAPAEDDTNGGDAGSAYVFERSGDSWPQ